MNGQFFEGLSDLFQPSPKQVRLQLIELRRRYSLSRAHLAAFMGTSRHTIRSWEKGLRDPSGPSKRLIQMVYLRMTSDVTGNCFIL